MAEMLYRKRGKRYVPDPELSALAPFRPLAFAASLLMNASRSTWHPHRSYQERSQHDHRHRSAAGAV